MPAAVPGGTEQFETPLPTPPSRTEQVYEAIVDDICAGRLTPGTPLRQEQLAERFHVSRQPVQQALLLLRNQGLLREFGRRGLEVAPVDHDFVSHLYDLRALIDGYAARQAAARRPDSWVERMADTVTAGEQALAERAFAHSIAADIEFHRSVVEAAGNPLLAESASVMWRNTQRVMGEVLLQGGAPAWVWEDHAAILAAIRDQDSDRAEALARRHAEHGERLILDGMAGARELWPRGYGREAEPELVAQLLGALEVDLVSVPGRQGLWWFGSAGRLWLTAWMPVGGAGGAAGDTGALDAGALPRAGAGRPRPEPKRGQCHISQIRVRAADRWRLGAKLLDRNTA